MALSTVSASERRWNGIIGVLFCLSGVPALVDQVAWQRVLAFHSGVGAFSVAVIVAAYMAGLGIGSLAGGAVSRRLDRRGALLAFALTELSIGLVAAFSTKFYYEMPLIPKSWFQGTTWRVGLVHLLVLLPPTSLMGMTFPLLSRAMVRDIPNAPRVIGGLYGLNILGAAIGAIITPWILIPRVGLSGAVGFAVACNGLVGLGAIVGGGLLGRLRPDSVENNPRPESDAGSSVRRRPFGLWIVLYTLSGFLAVALEVIWFRLIDVGVKATAYTFGTVLAVYLAGLAVGTLLGARKAGRWSDPLRVFLTCQCGVLIASGVSIVALTRLAPDTFWLANWFNYWASYEPMSPRHGDWWTTISLYFLFPMVLYGAPTILMGLSFGALQQGVQDEARTTGFKVGLLQAANIAGCVAGSLLVGLIGFANPGTAGTLRLLLATGIVMAVVGLATSRDRSRFLVMGASLILVAWIMPDQDVLWQRFQGARTSSILIAEDVAGVASLLPEGGRWRMSTNGKGQSHLPFGGIHSKLGAMPATLHPSPGSVAIIGLGSGDTAWASACRPETRQVTVFETCPGQLGLLQKLAELENPPGLRAFLQDPRVKVVEADGRHALATGGVTYDLIEADAIRPNGSSSGNLYSAEFFELCRKALNPGGMMCTWAPTPRVRSTFRQVFPCVLELDGGVILIGGNEPIGQDLEAWRARLMEPSVIAYLGPEAHHECMRCLPTALVLPKPLPADPDQINTDLFPRDEYERPMTSP